MAHSDVPKFGNWENGGNDVPYTVFFDKARKSKGGKMINPNDPQENPNMFRNFAASPSHPTPAPAPAPLTASTSKPRTGPDRPAGMGAVEVTPNRRMSSEYTNRRMSSEYTNRRMSSEYTNRRMSSEYTNSSARNEILGQGTTNVSTQQNYGGSRGMRYGRPVTAMSSAGSKYSIDRSPLHLHYQAKIVEGGSGSPAQEGKNSYNSSHGNLVRSRLKPTRGVESPDGGVAVPRFGEWNENDPQSAENFSDIFNKVREEKHPGHGIVSTTPTHPSYVSQNDQSKEKPKKCCFPWW